MASIHCEPDQVANTVALFPCSVVDFPIKYLGIPLAVAKLPKSALQPLLDQAVDRLPAWKGRLLQRCGRLTDNSVSNPNIHLDQLRSSTVVSQSHEEADDAVPLDWLGYGARG
jgi:hypothetical protein